jgi:hypothetical protein
LFVTQFSRFAAAYRACSLDAYLRLLYVGHRDMKKTLKTCPKGHEFYKSSDCPSCPTCAEQRRPTEGFMSLLSSPARSALEAAGVTTLKKLSTFTEKEILSLHGMGPKSIPTLKSALKTEGLDFKKKAPK